MSKRIIHYKRVSTSGQNLDRQDETVIMGATVYSEKCSGTIPFKDRPMSKATIIDEIEGGEIAEFHVHSIDRLGRNTLDIMKTIQWMTDNGVCVVSRKEGLRTLDDNGEENAISKMIVGVLGTLAEFDYKMKRKAQREGIEKAKERGVYIGGTGRKKGEVESLEKFLSKNKNKYILKLLNKGASVRTITALTKQKYGKCSSTTVVKVKEASMQLGKYHVEEKMKQELEEELRGK